MKGIWGSPWTGQHGLGHFISFFKSFYFIRILKNTLIISLSTLAVTFPAPIILALLLNEVRNKKFKKCVQTLSYMPHFISLVVICSMIRLFVADNGIVTGLLKSLGIVDGTYSLLSVPNYFVAIYVISGLWQTVGWDAIIYISALSGIDQGLYEAARIDGLSEFKIFLTIFMPTMKSTYAAALTVTFMNAWNNYLWPKVIMMSDTSQTMPMLVANLSVGYSIDYGVLMLGVLICSLPTGILFLVLQKSFANGIVGAVKG